MSAGVGTGVRGGGFAPEGVGGPALPSPPLPPLSPELSVEPWSVGFVGVTGSAGVGTGSVGVVTGSAGWGQGVQRCLQAGLRGSGL